MKTLKILGHTYTIIESRKLMYERGTAGTCCSGTLEITLDPGAMASRYEEALLHEIFEALNYHLSLSLDHDKMSALCEGVYAVLRDNAMKSDQW